MRCVSLYNPALRKIDKHQYKPSNKAGNVRLCTRCRGKGYELSTSESTIYRGMCLICYGRGVEGLVYIQTVEEKILQRRYQMLVHSYLYYELGESLVSDSTFDKWANELVELQESYPEEAEKVRYHRDFQDFDGSTGYDLPYDRPEVIKKAHQLLDYKRGN